MMMLRTRFTRLIGILGLFVVFMVTLSIAAPRSAQAASLCQSSPSDYNCNGRDPSATGCNNDAYGLGSPAPIVDQYGQTLGKVVIRYSPSCHTAWARITCYAGFQGCTASIDRYYDLEYNATWPNYSPTQVSFNTLMTYARGHCFYASGQVIRSGSDVGYGYTADQCA